MHLHCTGQQQLLKVSTASNKKCISILMIHCEILSASQAVFSHLMTEKLPDANIWQQQK